jgi:hypothetical protein
MCYKGLCVGMGFNGGGGRVEFHTVTRVRKHLFRTEIGVSTKNLGLFEDPRKESPVETEEKLVVGDLAACQAIRNTSEMFESGLQKMRSRYDAHNEVGGRHCEQLR